MTDVGELTVRIKADAAQLEREMRKVNTVVQQSAGDMGGRLSTLRGQLLALGGTLSLNSFVRSVTTFERLQASLRTVTGSAAAAASAFDMIQAFAATTPFDLEQTTAAFIKLTALGLTPSEAALRSYGNTASAMGKSLNQMIEAVADATTGEFERLKEFGIKTRQEGDSVVFTFQGVSTKVGKSAAEIEAYLRKIGDVNFAGAMKEQEGTLGTALSNMGDSFGRLANKIGEAGVTDLLIAMAAALTALNNALSDSIDTMNRLPASSDTMSPIDVQDGGFGTGGPGEFVFGQNPLRARKVSTTPFGPVYKPAPGTPTAPKEDKRAKQIADTRAALDDYNRSLQEEHALLALSDRDAVAQEARFRTEEIARRGHITLTKEQIDANVNLALSNYDQKQSQDEANRSIQEAVRFQQELHDKLATNLTDVAFKADSASDAMLRFAESIARAAFEKRIAGPFADALIGTGGSKGLLDDAISGVGSLFGGFFADGGSPPVGLPSVVGENGPEIFVPKTAGTIVPNHNLGGTTVIVQQTIQVNPGVPELINARIREASPGIAAMAVQSVATGLQSGGSLSRITGLRN